MFTDLVKENILSVRPFRGVLLKDALGRYTMFGAKLFPEFHADLIPALPHLNGDYFSRHV